MVGPAGCGGTCILPVCLVRLLRRSGVADVGRVPSPGWSDLRGEGSYSDTAMTLTKSPEAGRRCYEIAPRTSPFPSCLLFKQSNPGDRRIDVPPPRVFIPGIRLARGPTLNANHP